MRLTTAHYNSTMPACSRCTAALTPRYVLVFGDNDNEVDGCLHCSPRTLAVF
ncbi:DUF7563 family protein [Natronorubrum thiooxidans]